MDHGIEEVCTGEVKTAAAGVTLIANALGSCIAIIAYDPGKQIGGIAHIMLPGTAPDKKSCEKFRYAEDGIGELLRQMSAHGSDASDLCFIIAGAANVLERSDDMVCKMNINSVLAILQRRNIPVLAHSLGGVRRRRIKFNIARGFVECAVGEDGETVLWARK